MEQERSNAKLWSWALLALLLMTGGGLLALYTQPQSTQPGSPAVIGTMSLSEIDLETVKGFQEGLSALGYIDGESVLYNIAQAPETIDQLDDIARRHVANRVDLLFVSSTPAAQAAQKATAGTGIPVLFAPVAAPLDAGVVASLQRPGGNITGIQLPRNDGLRLQWLLRIAPTVKRVHVPYTPRDESALNTLTQIQSVAAIAGIQLSPEPVTSSADAAHAARNLPANIDAIFLPRDSLVESRIMDFVDSSIERKLPLSAPAHQQLKQGALFFYGHVHKELGKQAAHMANQILAGIPPGDLPVEVGESFLGVNLQTAAMIGLSVPEDVLRAADFIIYPAPTPDRGSPRQ